MSNRPDLEVDYCILCDEIRQEHNGKGLFIGVYTGSVETRMDNLDGNFSCALQIKVNTLGNFSFAFSTYFNGEHRKSLEGEFSAEATGTAFFPIPVEFGKLSESGTMTLKMSIDRNAPFEILSKEFRCHPPE